MTRRIDHVLVGCRTLGIYLEALTGTTVELLREDTTYHRLECPAAPTDAEHIALAADLLIDIDCSLNDRLEDTCHCRPTSGLTTAQADQIWPLTVPVDVLNTATQQLGLGRLISTVQHLVRYRLWAAHAEAVGRVDASTLTQLDAVADTLHVRLQGQLRALGKTDSARLGALYQLWSTVSDQLFPVAAAELGARVDLFRVVAYATDARATGRVVDAAGLLSALRLTPTMPSVDLRTLFRTLADQVNALAAEPLELTGDDNQVGILVSLRSNLDTDAFSELGLAIAPLLLPVTGTEWSYIRFDEPRRQATLGICATTCTLAEVTTRHPRIESLGVTGPLVEPVRSVLVTLLSTDTLPDPASAGDVARGIVSGTTRLS